MLQEYRCNHRDSHGEGMSMIEGAMQNNYRSSDLDYLWVLILEQKLCEIVRSSDVKNKK